MMSKRLTDVFAMLRMDPRLWKVLEARIDKRLTLEETGKLIGGITRERVRQLERKVPRNFSNHIKLISLSLDVVEDGFKKIRRENTRGINESATDNDRESLTSQSKSILVSRGYSVTADDISKLILLVRALVFLNRSELSKSVAEKNWPRFTRLACKLSPPVTQHREIAKWVKQEYQLTRKLSYKELAYQILAEASKPLHWSEIVEQAYRLERRPSFNSTALYNALINHRDVFVRVGQGTYALSEWGASRVDTYPDIITSILKQEQKPLPLETLYSHVNSIRPIKRTTLVMFLDLHPRFYKSIESTYGLRSWLSPREKQTLRTPEWLIEVSSSYERVERATGRGYNVDSIIESDRQGQ